MSGIELKKQPIIRMLKDSLPPIFEVAEAKALLSPYYRAPLKLLAALEEDHAVIRLKRGTYAFVDGFDPLAAASLLHGPSYVSFETALCHYGMVPERVHQILAVVDGRSAAFNTPEGQYVYRSQHRELFALGMTLEVRPHDTLAIANPEKALLDTLSSAKLQAAVSSPRQILEYVTDGLRIDVDVLARLSLKKIDTMAKLYRNHAPMRLAEALATLR